MSDPFLGEIKVISFNFPPKGWAFCNGQLLPINQNQALFSILGTQFGGNGQTTFGLPNLQGRMPIHVGGGYTIGNVGGEAAHTLTVNEIPAHNHPPRAQSAVNSPGIDPTNEIWAGGNVTAFAASANTTMSSSAIGNAGGSQPHENQAPYLVLNYIIALTGIFPSQS